MLQVPREQLAEEIRHRRHQSVTTYMKETAKISFVLAAGVAEVLVEGLDLERPLVDSNGRRETTGGVWAVRSRAGGEDFVGESVRAGASPSLTALERQAAARGPRGMCRRRPARAPCVARGAVEGGVRRFARHDLVGKGLGSSARPERVSAT